MARTGQEWAIMANKYGYGIDATKATPQELVEFVQTVIYLNETADLTDNDVWFGFQELCEGFTVENFKKIPTDIRSKLRKHHLQRGVYVGKHNNRVTISELLFEVTQQEELHQWTDEEIKATIKELAEPMHTRALRDRLNQTFDGLATGPRLIQPTTLATIPPVESQPAEHQLQPPVEHRLQPPVGSRLQLLMESRPVEPQPQPPVESRPVESQPQPPAESQPPIKCQSQLQPPAEYQLQLPAESQPPVELRCTLKDFWPIERVLSSRTAHLSTPLLAKPLPNLKQSTLDLWLPCCLNSKPQSMSQSALRPKSMRSLLRTKIRIITFLLVATYDISYSNAFAIAFKLLFKNAFTIAIASDDRTTGGTRTWMRGDIYSVCSVSTPAYSANYPSCSATLPT